jgi:choline dehydrogenase-like flavoprotein
MQMTQNRLETDIVVVGSGAGGAAIAGELGRNGRTTLIVEAGPKRTDPPGSHVRNNTPSEKKLPNELYLTVILFYGDVAGPRTCTFN